MVEVPGNQRDVAVSALTNGLAIVHTLYNRQQSNTRREGRREGGREGGREGRREGGREGGRSIEKMTPQSHLHTQCKFQKLQLLLLEL